MAILTIHGREVVFDFSTITNWNTQSGDPFSLNVQIGGQNCFVKKFIKYPPKSKDLLTHFDDRETVGIPTVFEYQRVDELGESVYYLVQKMVSGDIFEKVLLQDNHQVNLKQFVQQIFWGYKEIHSKNHWHCDFCFKNLMVDVPAREYTLIDIDSCLPSTIKPNVDTAINLDLIGGIGLIFEELGYVFDWTDKIDGKTYNHLQLAMAVFHLAQCNRDESLNARPKWINKTAKFFLKNNTYVVNFLLNGIVNGFTESDFKQVIPRINSYSDLMDDGNVFNQIDKTLFNKVEKKGLLRKFGTSEPQKPVTQETLKEPKFHQFEVNDRTAILNVKKYECVTVKWIVSNANEIRYKDKLIGNSEKGQAKIQITNPVDLQLTAFNKQNGKTAIAVSDKIVVKIKDPKPKKEHIVTPRIELWVNGKPINNNELNINCSEVVEVAWKGNSAKEMYFNNEKVKTYDRKTLKIRKPQINIKFKAVNYGAKRNIVETTTRTINLHPQLANPVINYVEINGKRKTQFVFGYEEEVNLSWSAKNTNAIYLGDKLISDKPVGTYKLKIKSDGFLHLKAVNKSENNNLSKEINYRPLKVNIRTKIIDAYSTTPRFRVLTLNGLSFLNISTLFLSDEESINIFVQTTDAYAIYIKGEYTPTSEIKIFKGNQAQITIPLEYLEGEDYLIIEAKGKSYASAPQRVIKKIKIDRQEVEIDYPILNIQIVEINGQDVLENPVYTYKKDEKLNLTLNIQNAKEVKLNNNHISPSSITSLGMGNDSHNTLDILHWVGNGELQKITIPIILVSKTKKQSSNAWAWWLIAIIILGFILLMLGG